MERPVQQFVNNNQVHDRDYEDDLKPGYRFSPSDAELIVHYLKPKIERDEHPYGRLHQVNIYKYPPQDLASNYRSSDKKWYFLTPRARISPNDRRPDRKVGDFGRWKATLKGKPVLDNGKEVGKKSCLEFEDKNGKKTEWLMHEYTTMDCDLPLGTEPKTMLSKCVLCKIYKIKENKETKKRNINEANKQIVIEDEQNGVVQNDVMSPKRARLSEQGAYASTSSQIDQSSYDESMIVVTTPPPVGASTCSHIDRSSYDESMIVVTPPQLTFHSNLVDDNIYSIQHVQEFCNPSSMHFTSLGASTSTSLQNVQTPYSYDESMIVVTPSMHLTSLGASTSTCLQNVQTSYDESMIVTTPSSVEARLQVLDDMLSDDCFDIPDDWLAKDDLLFNTEELERLL